MTRCPRDFTEALLAIDACLQAHEPTKQSAWRTQSVLEHAQHATAHALTLEKLLTLQEDRGRDYISDDDVVEELTHLGCRVLFALQLWQTRDDV